MSMRFFVGNLTTFLVSTQQIQRALAQLSVLFGAAETSFWCRFLLNESDICQDRLGTNIGNVETKETSLQGAR